MVYCLLSLYQSILVPILSEWINDTDLCYLDTAVCSEKLRKDFLNHMSYCGVPGCSDDYHRYKYDWIRRRGMRLTSVTIESLSGLQCIPRELLVSSTLKYCSVPLVHDCIDYLEQLGISSRSLRVLSKNADDALLLRALSLCPELTELDVSRCEMSEEIAALEVIAGCHQLRKLRLNPSSSLEACPVEYVFNWNCSIGSTKVYASCDLVQVKEATDNSVKLAQQYYCLTAMRFACSTVILTDIDVFSRMCVPLVSLTIVMMYQSPEIIPLLCSKCVNLTYFNCHCRMDADELKTLLRNNPQLLTLELERVCCVDESVVEVIAECCHDLVKLEIYEFDASVSSLISLFEKCVSLEHVELRQCPALRPFFITHMKNCAILTISQRMHGRTILWDHLQHGKKTFISMNKQYDSAELLAIFANNPMLHTINLVNLYQVTPSVLSSLIAMCPGLTDVSLSVDDECVLHFDDLVLLKDCKHLTALTLYGNKKITSNVLCVLLEGKRNMASLILNCRVSSKVLQLIAQYCPIIRRVSVQFARINDSDVHTLLTCCPRLDHLRLYKCRGLTNAVLESLRCRRMRYLDVNGVFGAEMMTEFIASGFDPLCLVVY